MTQLRLFDEQQNKSPVVLANNSNSDVPVILDMMGGITNSKYSDLLGKIVFDHDVKAEYIDRLEGYLLFSYMGQVDKNTIEFAARGARTVVKLQNMIVGVLEANGFMANLQNPVTEERCTALCNEAKNYRLSKRS